MMSLSEFWIASVVHMSGIVPQLDHRLGQAVFVSEHTQACCVQHENSPGGGFEPKPAGREHAQKMSARKNQNIAFDPSHTAHNVIGPGANLVRRFAPGASVAEEKPIRALRANLFRSETSVIAVVPFDQVAIDFG